MTLQLTLSPELKERLHFEAERRGEQVEAVALRLLDEHLPVRLDVRRAAAVAMLQQWMREDEAISPEDSEKADEFFRGLDAARTSNRPLYPPELEGISW
jgi:hypothetical protein